MKKVVAATPTISNPHSFRWKYGFCMKKIFVTSLTLLICFCIKAQKLEVFGARKAVRTSGDIFVTALPASCLITTVSIQDWQGLKQGVFTGLLTAGVGSGLKYLVDKERPDKSNNMSFPSLHTGTSFASAAFIQRRYGWEWGIPSYAVAVYVGWSRVYGKKHDWWDVTAGAALGIGSAYLFTRSYKSDTAIEENISFSINSNDSSSNMNSGKLIGIAAGTAAGIGGAYLLSKLFAKQENFSIAPVAYDRYVGLYASLCF